MMIFSIFFTDINFNNNVFGYKDFFTEGLRITFQTIPYDIARWLFRPNFSWQNAVVSTATKGVVARTHKFEHVIWGLTRWAGARIFGLLRQKIKQPAHVIKDKEGRAVRG